VHHTWANKKRKGEGCVRCGEERGSWVTTDEGVGEGLWSE